MGMIKRSCIEAIKSRVSIHDVVAPYVTLKRAGQNWKGLSPFTNEKTPSFSLHSHKNIFKCFSSGHAGDIFRFLQLKENLNFQEAIELIAHRFNIPLEYEEGSQDEHSVSMRKQLFTVHEVATEFFYQQFIAATDLGASARDYWVKERKFPLTLAQTFQVGVAPLKENALLEALLKYQFSLEVLQACGLFYIREGDKRLSALKPRFLGRLMIPIKDIQGRVIAFSGRKLPIGLAQDPTAEAKYINSPETILFYKSHVLFGLDQARSHANSETPFYLVEGPLDVMRCVERGIKTAIAPQGTAITEPQLETLRRYTAKLHMFLDGDAAGQKAALRALPLAFKSELEISFLSLPNGADPDTFLLKYPEVSLEKLMPKAESAMQFLEKTLFAGKETFKPNQLSNALSAVYDIIQQANTNILQIGYLKELCTLLAIDFEAAQKDFEKFKQFHQHQGSRTFVESATTLTVSSPEAGKLTTVEQELLLLILHYDGLAKGIAQLLELEWVDTQSIHGMLLVRLINELKEGEHDNLKNLDMLLETDTEKDLIYGLLGQEVIFESPLKVANQCLKKIFSQFIYRRREEIELLMSHISKEQNEQLRELQQERIQLRKLLQDPPQLNLANFPNFSNSFSSFV
jgi:DNA primase